MKNLRKFRVFESEEDMDKFAKMDPRFNPEDTDLPGYGPMDIKGLPFGDYRHKELLAKLDRLSSSHKFADQALYHYINGLLLTGKLDDQYFDAITKEFVEKMEEVPAESGGFKMGFFQKLFRSNIYSR